MRRPLKRWAWDRLVYAADRIAPDEAFRCTGLRLRFNHTTKRFEVSQFAPASDDWDDGCQIWYRGKAESDAIFGWTR